MLTELRVHDLGVIADVGLVLEPGMTALTGETGAGKTMLVEAIELLMGGRADPVLVRPGCTEAVVEGRFLLATRDGEVDVVLTRVIPASGRSRAYIDGRMVPVASLAELGARLVELHGQHAHQSLLHAATQRRALDAHAGVDLARLADARAALRAVEAGLASLGGDDRARARELDLLRFQLAEIDAAHLDDVDEEAALEAEEDRLAGAGGHQEAAGRAYLALQGDGGAGDVVAQAIATIAGRPPFAEVEARLRSVGAELGEAAVDLRALSELLEHDPERLAAVVERRHRLRELRRKYGDDLAGVVAFAQSCRARVDELEGHGARAVELAHECEVASAAMRAAEAVVGSARRSGASALASAIEERLHTLAMPRARFEVVVPDADPGDGVAFLLGANPGEPALPLSKVASGGELARTMLAARLVLSGGAPTSVFDEVDAGIGGEAALAVGRALAELADERRAQVLVVTHLAQVAAFADHQVAVRKDERDGRTVAAAHRLDRDARVVELARMLSGQPGSTAALDHAEELLANASRLRPAS